MSMWFLLKVGVLLSLAVAAGLLKRYQFDEEKKREEKEIC